MIEINVFKAMMEKANFNISYEENYLGDTEIHVSIDKDKIYNKQAQKALTELLVNSDYVKEETSGYYCLDVYEIKDENTYFTEVIWSIE